MIVTINVTQDDIDGGKPEESFQCPLALATNRATGLYSSVYIDVELWSDRADMERSQLGRGGTVAIVALPREALRFRNRFDDGYEVEPFTFTLDIPESVLRK